MSDPFSPQPPSQPRPSSPGVPPGGGGALAALASMQLVGAFLLGLLLLAVPLYLWRRPRSIQSPVRPDAAAAEPVRDAGPPVPVPVEAAAPSPVHLADARVLECHDPGSKHTAPDQCDHIPAFEKALADAIVASHDCVPGDAGNGSIEYVADLSFARKHNPITVALPSDGRSYKNQKIVSSCAAGVKNRLAALPLLPLTHAHSRYKVAVIASYVAGGAP